MRNECVKLVEELLLKDGEDIYDVTNIDDGGKLLDEIYKDTIAFIDDETKRDYLRTYKFKIKEDIKEKFVEKIEGIVESLDKYSSTRARLDVGNGTNKSANVVDQISHKPDGQYYILHIDIEKVV